MLFNSVEFIVFFIIVTTLYFLLPHKFRWFHLLIASCLFYMAFIPVYILILFVTIAIDYVAGIMIENAEGKKRRGLLVVSILVNVGMLGVFKYYNFFIDNINFLIDTAGATSKLPLMGIILPLGLSFHTFQAMSYTIEVYRGHQKAERHLGIYALYVMFYPQLVAGPIERPQNLLHQFHEKHHFRYEDVTNGLKLMLWGLFKKIVIADRLSVFTDQVYNDVHNQSALSITIAAVFFSFQIFCDFSGYSDIAIGSAQVMGFKLMTNFDRPYSAKSISEFWSRWHISLSTWFKDYLYISLGGNRVPVPRWYFNLFIVFLVSGFWHGASWNFIIWGALHGFYLIFALVSQKPRKYLWEVTGLVKIEWLYNFVQKSTTFVLVTIAWVFFRAETFGKAIHILRRIPACVGDIKAIISKGVIPYAPVQIKLIAASFFWILVLETIHFLQRKNNILMLVNNRPMAARWAIYYIAIGCIIFFGVFEQKQFIYFQF